MKIKRNLIREIGHGTLSDVQGGVDGEAYHLTEEEHSKIQALTDGATYTSCFPVTGTAMIETRLPEGFYPVMYVARISGTPAYALDDKMFTFESDGFSPYLVAEGDANTGVILSLAAAQVRSLSNYYGVNMFYVFSKAV